MIRDEVLCEKFTAKYVNSDRLTEEGWEFVRRSWRKMIDPIGPCSHYVIKIKLIVDVSFDRINFIKTEVRQYTNTFSNPGNNGVELKVPIFPGDQDNAAKLITSVLEINESKRRYE